MIMADVQNTKILEMVMVPSCLPYFGYGLRLSADRLFYLVFTMTRIPTVKLKIPGKTFLTVTTSSGEKGVEIVKTLHVKFFPFGSAEPV